MAIYEGENTNSCWRGDCHGGILNKISKLIAGYCKIFCLPLRMQRMLQWCSPQGEGTGRSLAYHAQDRKVMLEKTFCT